MSGVLSNGQRVRFLADNLGTIALHQPYGFTEVVVGNGDEGTLYTDVGDMPHGWVLVKIEQRDEHGNELYVPVHPDHLEPAVAAEAV